MNGLIKLSDKEISKLVNQVLEEINDESAKKVREAKIEKAKARLNSPEFLDEIRYWHKLH